MNYQNFAKKVFITALAFFAITLFAGLTTSAVYAQSNGPVDTDYLFTGDNPNVGSADDLQAETGLGSRDPREIAASVINIILGFLGIIAVILILVGGFRWMMAQGNDDAIASAKSLMTAGVVGLLIILAAFGIARFVIDALISATT